MAASVSLTHWSLRSRCFILVIVPDLSWNILVYLYLFPFFLDRCLCTLSTSAGRGPLLLEYLVNVFYKHLSGTNSDSQVLFYFLIHWIGAAILYKYMENETCLHTGVFVFWSLWLIYYLQLRTMVEVHLSCIYWAWKLLFLYQVSYAYCIRSANYFHSGLSY